MANESTSISETTIKVASTEVIFSKLLALTTGADDDAPLFSAQEALRLSGFLSKLAGKRRPIVGLIRYVFDVLDRTYEDNPGFVLINSASIAGTLAENEKDARLLTDIINAILKPCWDVYLLRHTVTVADIPTMYRQLLAIQDPNQPERALFGEGDVKDLLAVFVDLAGRPCSIGEFIAVGGLLIAGMDSSFYMFHLSNILPALLETDGSEVILPGITVAATAAEGGNRMLAMRVKDGAAAYDDRRSARRRVDAVLR